MGFGTEVKVYANRITKNDAERIMEGEKTNQEYIEEEIKALVYSTPYSVTDCDGNVMPPHEWIPGKIISLLEELQESSVNYFLAEQVHTADRNDIVEDY